MADEEKTEEKVDKEALDAAIEAGEKEEEGFPKEVLDKMDEFDKIVDGEEEDPAVEGEEKVGKKEDGEEKTAKEETPAEEAAVELTAEEKEIEAEVEYIGKTKVTDGQKSPDLIKAEKIIADLKAEAAESKKKSDDEEKPFDCGLSTEGKDGAEGWDKELVDSLNKQGQDQQDTIKALKTRNENLSGQLINANTQRTVDWFDGRVERLGDDFTETLGEGDLEDLGIESDQYDNRMKIITRMNLVKKAYANLDKPIPSRNRLFQSAVTKLFNKELNKPKTDADTVEKLAERKGQTISRAKSKKTAKSVHEKAVEEMKAFDKKLDA